MEVIRTIGDWSKDFFMGLTHAQAGFLTVGVATGILILALT